MYFYVLTFQEIKREEEISRLHVIPTNLDTKNTHLLFLTYAI